jgi:hypothetical protein
MHKRTTSAVKRVEFVSYRMLYIILRGHWCDMIVLKLHVPKKDKIYDMKVNFYDELEHVFDKVPKYHMNIF